MKISLKSPGLDLDIDDVPKLDDVLQFIKDFHELQLKVKEAESQLNLKTLSQAKRRKKQ